MSALKARDLVFDLGGVLVDWDPLYLYRDHLGASAADSEHLLGVVCTREWHDLLDRGMTFSVATRRLASQYPELAEQIRDWDKGWAHMFKGSRPGVDTLLRQLRADGYRLHVLSNHPAEKLDFLYSNFEFMRHFHSVIISGLLATAKPDTAIFAYLMKLLDNRPVIFFDDRIENVQAASTAGLQAHHCQPHSNLAEVVAKAIGKRY